VGDTIKVRCHLLRDRGEGCLLGFVTPMHGDKARGHGVEIERTGTRWRTWTLFNLSTTHVTRPTSSRVSARLGVGGRTRT
jgi:hypothetical protein